LLERFEAFFETKQPWGASWKGLESKIQEHLCNLYKNSIVYGIELSGKNSFNAINIDHHRYRDEDRSNKLSSLEQVAEILGCPLNRWRRLVAANDRAWIPGMLAEGASMEELEAVRNQDRQVQGLNPDHKRQAVLDINKAERHGRKMFVQCHKGINSFHSDLLWGSADEWLLTSPHLWTYSGNRVEYFQQLDLPEEYWLGGSSSFGYFGVSHPGEDSQQKMLSVFWI
jgi:hypothetical protein